MYAFMPAACWGGAAGLKSTALAHVFSLPVHPTAAPYWEVPLDNFGACENPVPGPDGQLYQVRRVQSWPGRDGGCMRGTLEEGLLRTRTAGLQVLTCMQAVTAPMRSPFTPNSSPAALTHPRPRHPLPPWPRTSSLLRPLRPLRLLRTARPLQWQAPSPMTSWLRVER